MRLISLTVHGLTWPFACSTVTIDFAGLGAGLIALVGPNGAGKTTLLEASGPLTLHRRSAYYEVGFASMVAAPDAFSELTFALGSESWRLRVQSDGKKTEAYLHQQEGGVWRPVAGPLLTDVDAVLARLRPGLDFFLASAFAGQRNRQSFFELPKAQRKDLFTVPLQLGELQALADAAAERATADAAQCEATGQRLAELWDTAERAGFVREELLPLRMTRGGLEQDLGGLEESLRDAQAIVERESADFGRANAEWSQAEAAREVAALDLHRAERQRAALGERAAQATRRLHQAAAIEQAALTVEWLQPLARQHAADLAEAEEALCAALEQATVAAREKAAVEADGRTLRAQLDLLGAQAQALEGVEDVTQAMCQRCPLTAQGLQAARERDQVQARLVAVREAWKGAERRQLDAEAEVGTRRARQVASRAAVATVATDLEAAERLSRLLPEVRQAEAELGHLREAQDALDAQVTRLKAAASVTPLPRPSDAALLRAQAGRTTLMASRDRLHRERQAVTDRIAHLEGQLVALGDLDEARGVLEATQAAQARDAQEWRLLARGLGRDGVQALLIANAGPEVQQIANDLLAEGYGPRFQLRFVTTQPLKGGGVKEVFDIEIIDSEAGRTGTRVSGGEQAVLDEAVRLALSIYQTRRSGFPMATAWRDETAGPLDPTNAQAYVRMLKAARALGGFEQILLICHSPEVWSQADVRLYVANGAVSVERPTEEAA